MNPINITFTINSLSIAISEKLSDEELDFVAAIFTQLGDTLATISATRGLKSNSNCSEEI